MSKAIPEKASRKQAELCGEILALADREVARGIPADQVIARLYRQHREFGSRDRRFFSELVFSWFRWRGWLACPKQPQGPDIIAAYLLDATDVHPAIDHLAALSGWAHDLQPLADADLPRKSEKTREWLNLPNPPPAEQLVPTWTAEALHYPDNEKKQKHLFRCIEAFQSRPPLWVRLKNEVPPETTAEARSVGTLPPRALKLENRSDWENLKRHHVGDAEIQDLSSQCVGAICAPAPGEKWWDVCAGAGGKALHLADLMGSGSILSTDIRAAILDECARRARRAGIRLIECLQWDGTGDPAPDQMFDGALVDAPCSGIGTWPRNPDARWRTTQETITQRTESQTRLLHAASGKIRAGGRLIYAICTLTHAESIGIVSAFLKNHPSFQLISTPHPVTGADTGGMIWIWPWLAESNGMFIAHFRKS